MAPPTWALLAGGGTAGHVLPAVATARALVARGHPAATLHFVGSSRGVEARVVPDAGFGVTLLPGRGIARRLTAANVAAAAGLVAGVARAVWLVARRRPHVVLSVGGYASVPCAFAAAVWRVPVVVHEQNAVPGLANRLAGRVARACAVSFDGTDLPRAVTTGNPVRPEIHAVDRSPAGRAAARRRLQLPVDAVVVVVVGGSLGARRINDAALGLARLWAGRRGVAVRHVVGRRDWAEFAGPAATAAGDDGLVYQAVEYENDMPAVLGAADVVVSRAGGTSVAELAVVGVASILVPLPGAPGDHQTANAAALVGAGAAVLVPDAELSAERLAAELGALVDDADRRRRMGEAARGVARDDAAERLADLVEAHARPVPAGRS